MSGHHKHLSTDPKHHQLNTSSTNQTTTQEITLKSTPRKPGQEIHSPIQLKTSQTKSQNQEQKSDAHLGITDLWGRAGDRPPPKAIPRGDLVTVIVDLCGGSEKC